MQRHDRLDRENASVYPGHIIVVSGDKVRITARLAVKGGNPKSFTMNLLNLPSKWQCSCASETPCQSAFWTSKYIWPDRLGHLVPWNP